MFAQVPLHHHHHLQFIWHVAQELYIFLLSIIQQLFLVLGRIMTPYHGFITIFNLADLIWGSKGLPEMSVSSIYKRLMVGY